MVFHAASVSETVEPKGYTVPVNRAPKLLALALLLAAVANSFAVVVTGKWVGHLNVKFVPPAGMKPAPSPDDIKSVETALKAVTVELTILANGTYKAVTRGTGQEKKPSTGKWKLKGRTLMLTPDDKRPPETGTLSANGKTMTVSLPKDMTLKGMTGNAIFKKS